MGDLGGSILRVVVDNDNTELGCGHLTVECLELGQERRSPVQGRDHDGDVAVEFVVRRNGCHAAGPG